MVGILVSCQEKFEPKHLFVVFFHVEKRGGIHTKLCLQTSPDSGLQAMIRVLKPLVTEELDDP